MFHVHGHELTCPHGCAAAAGQPVSKECVTDFMAFGSSQRPGSIRCTYRAADTVCAAACDLMLATTVDPDNCVTHGEAMNECARACMQATSLSNCHFIPDFHASVKAGINDLTKAGVQLFVEQLVGAPQPAAQQLGLRMQHAGAHADANKLNSKRRGLG